MRRIGARVHDGLKIERTEFAEDLRGLGLESAQLTLPKFYPGYGFCDDADSLRVVRRIREEFDAADVSIAVLSAYVNPVHPDDGRGDGAVQAVCPVCGRDGRGHRGYGDWHGDRTFRA